jgi:hypothetical protein
MPDRRDENAREDRESPQDRRPQGGGAGPEYGRGADDRSWIDRCADDECLGRRHRGRGPKDWSRDDQRLYEEICERLLQDRLIDARGITVEVEDGVVVLRGEARAAADPLLVQRLVLDTAGVKGLEIDLRVRPRPQGVAPAAPRIEDQGDDRVDKSSLAAPLVPGRAPPPDSAGAP